MSDKLGVVETGNRPWIAAIVTAPAVPGHITDASTAITFNTMTPAGALGTPVSSPNTDIAGPVAGTTTGRYPDGTTVTLTTTTWYWKVPLVALVGTYQIRWSSTAGVIAQDNSTWYTPTYDPWAAA